MLYLDSHRPHDRDRKDLSFYPRSPSIRAFRGAWPAAFDEKGLLGGLTHGVLEDAMPMLVVALPCLF